MFALYASPATLAAGTREVGDRARFPGVVLIHGGGGTAFAEWVHLWAKRGYAAIAMDLAGSRPIDPIYDASGAPVPNQAAKPETRQRLPNGGPLQAAALHYTTDGGLRSARKWQSVDAKFDGSVVRTPRPPEDANTWFVSLTDERGAMVTTPVQLRRE